ncbi:peroxiredoxin family protein [Nocardia sp. NEAU-G5]|uniref:Peroxiredoxin family protein n=1 Tax=Nocardia albiluteola TaxID=2842303 RepID=A0ABS6B5R8_9NOCA|nr:redoxin domain-containing protein [Nocardia albiluteola]MBU3062506.1 peroxiredoxin family protein [Nocardia albiluteola]MBU3065660.1 peroxiredoxin family protein [Nocardia albiluteola]
MSKGHIAMLTTGSAAPDMQLEDTAGNTWRLSDQLGTHGALLFFVRSTSCPICNRHVRDLLAQRGGFEADDVRLYLAIPEAHDAGRAWRTQHRITVPVLVGSAGSPHQSVGLTRRLFGSMQQSGSVLVDPGGIVRHAHGATMPVNSYDKKGIQAAIRAMRGPAGT